MLRRDGNVILRIRKSNFCPSSPDPGPSTDEGGQCVLGETSMWKVAEGTAGARHEWTLFVPVLNLECPV